jgi:hypothetical protein
MGRSCFLVWTVLAGHSYCKTLSHWTGMICTLFLVSLQTDLKICYLPPKSMLSGRRVPSGFWTCESQAQFPSR